MFELPKLYLQIEISQAKLSMTPAGRIFFDLLNEPDGFNFTWSYPNINTRGLYPNSSVVPAWGDLYTDTAASLVEQEPALLLLAEGTGQYNQPGTAYGMKFKCTLLSLISVAWLFVKI